MRGFFRAVFSDPPGEKEAELTLSGLRVRSEDGQGNVYRWHEMNAPRDTSGSSYRLTIVDAKGDRILKDGKPQFLKVKGGREARLCRRAYLRGLKQILRDSDIELEISSEKALTSAITFLITSVMAVMFLVSGCSMLIGKIDTFFKDGIDPGGIFGPDFIILSYIVGFLTGLLSISVLIFVLWIAISFGIQFYRLRYVTCDVRAFMFSSHGLVCVNGNAMRTSHSWEILKPPTRFLPRIRFTDGLVVYPGSNNRTTDIVKTIFGLYFPRTRQKGIRQFILRCVVSIVLLISVYFFTSFALNAVDVDGEGALTHMIWPIMLVATIQVGMALSVSFMETDHPLFKRIRRRFQRWRRRKI